VLAAEGNAEPEGGPLEIASNGIVSRSFLGKTRNRGG
jgi:hypothetical protein